MENKIIKTILAEKNLTELEIRVIKCLVNKLDSWIGVETYSPVEHSDISEAIGLTIKQVKGVVGSLVKKNIVEVYEHEECRGWDGRIEEPAHHVINFVGQDTMIK